MTQPKLKIAFNFCSFILTFCFMFESCNSNVSEIDENLTGTDNLEIETDQQLIEKDTLSENREVIPSELTSSDLDSLKNHFQKKLDTGIDMLGTAREEYLFLCDLKDAYKEWLELDCLAEYMKDSINIDKWEASVKCAIEIKSEELKKEYPAEDWGQDMEMIIYGAGSEQLYLFLEDLITSSKSWCI